MTKKRIEWLDFARVFVMFLVIVDHLGLENRFIRDFIWSFHMPVFFFISGIFHSNKLPWGEFLKKNFFRLLLPVVLWHIISMCSWDPIFYYVTDHSNWLSHYVQAQVDFVTGNICGFGWFMICLFWLKVIDKLLANLKYGGVCCILLPLICYCINTEIRIPFYVLNAFMAYPFFKFGFYMKGRLTSGAILSVQKKCAYMLLSFLLLVALVAYNTCGSLNAIEYGKNALICYLQGFIGCLFIVSLCMSIYQLLGHKASFTLGNGTIVLLLLQPPFLLAFKLIYRALFHPAHSAPYFDIFSAMISAVVIITIMYPIILIINKKAPALNGIK